MKNPDRYKATFNIPDLWERVPMGVWVGGSLGYMDDGQLPNITGGFPMQGKDMTWGRFIRIQTALLWRA